MRERAVADPNSELHIDVNMLVPVALKIPRMPYAVRRARNGDASNRHLIICEFPRGVG
jgi:hypothetical protein